MPLSLSELEDCQCEAMADDVEIDYHRMTNWTREQALAYFESGGTQEPALAAAETLALGRVRVLGRRRGSQGRTTMG